jgi:hypothetical protein
MEEKETIASQDPFDVKLKEAKSSPTKNPIQ